MPTDVIQHLRRAVLLHDQADLTDGQLLGCFVEHRDEDAFAALVRRHGPMVWGVCRRVLAHDADAEDAFQATFLVLVRKAACVVPREMVGNWLYGVAHQAALKARRTVVRRREKQVAVPDLAVAAPDSGNDVRPLLDEELSRLPDKYRVVLVLCDLEGKTRKEAARQLGWPEGTVAGRLARAREILARRLARRGVSLSALAGLAPAGVPGIVLSSTIEAATRGAISAPAAVLIQGVLNAMFVTKLKTAALVLAMLGAATLPCGMLAGKGGGAEKPAAKGEAETPAKKVAPDPKADALRRERKKFEGAWRVAYYEYNNKKITRRDFGNLLVFDAEGGWKIQMDDGSTLNWGTSEIDLDAKPRSIHLTGQHKGDDGSKTLRQIYEFIDANSLRTSIYLSEEDRPKDFSTKAGRLVYIYQRGQNRARLKGTVKEIDDKSILLTSGERVTLDAKTEFLRETGDDAAVIRRKDVTKGKVVSIHTKKQGENLVAVLVVVARMQPDPKETDTAILERLKQQGLKVPATADDMTFIRRLYLDILGFPPSPRVIEDFVKDKDADKRAKLRLRLTTRPAPGQYTGAGQVMMIDAKGVITYADSPGPVICHIELLEDGGLKAEFPDKDLGRGRWHTVTLKLTAKEPFTVWTATVKGDTYKVTSMPYSPEAHVFRLEILTGGKVVAGAQQFFAIREVRAGKK